MTERPAEPDSGDRDIDFPEMRQSTVGSETLARYFQDLREVADVQDIRLKAASDAYAGDETVDLERARSLLLNGDVRGIQIRYTWRGEAWWDTLMHGDRGVEITRVQPPSFDELD